MDVLAMDQIGELSARQDLAESKYPRATYLALWRTGAGAPQDSIKASPDKIRPKALGKVV